MSLEKPAIRVSPIRTEDEGPAGRVMVGPFVELGLGALTFLDDLVRTDQRAAREYISDMIAALQDDIQGKDSKLG
jgi:hypothetical protein